MTDKLPSKMGRPKVEIREEEFVKLCGLQCTTEEIANWFHCSTDTIRRWCVLTYGETFAEVYKRFSSIGKSSLRRWLWHNAERGNVPIQIWLSKQHLDMKDQPDIAPPKEETKEYVVLWEDEHKPSISEDAPQDRGAEEITPIKDKI